MTSRAGIRRSNPARAGEKNQSTSNPTGVPVRRAWWRMARWAAATFQARAALVGCHGRNSGLMTSTAADGAAGTPPALTGNRPRNRAASLARSRSFGPRSGAGSRYATDPGAGQRVATSWLLTREGDAQSPEPTTQRRIGSGGSAVFVVSGTTPVIPGGP